MLRVTGFRISTLNYAEVIHTALSSRSKSFVISTLNVPLLKEAGKNRKYARALVDSSVIIPDGIGFVWASRLIYGKRGLSQRVTGPDLFLEFCKKANKERLRFFFLGSSSGVLAKIARRLQEEFPAIHLAGLYSPPFGPWDLSENKKIIDAVNEARADVLWVGMTAPRQETWIYENKEQLDVKVIAAIGAAFDFFAGTRKRAPRLMQRLGLEWFYRVCQEPLRLGRRYFTTIPFFLIRVLSDWLRRKGA